MPTIEATYQHNWCSAVGALSGILRALDTDLPSARVSALSGHAFRLAIVSSVTDGGEAEHLDGQSVNHFTSASALPLYALLGWRFEALECPHDSPGFAAARDAVIGRTVQ